MVYLQLMSETGAAERPRVTILIVTFNRASLVCRAIDSALAQTYPNLQVVVVDDGSTDRTTEVLRPYEDNPQVRVVRHERNLGVTSARNTGLAQLTDETTYFAFVDSDDTLLPGAVEALMRVLEPSAGQYSMAMGWGRNVASGTPTGRMTHLPGREGLVTFEDALAGHFLGDFWLLVRQDMLGTLRFEERASGAEGSVWWRLLKQSPGRLVQDIVLNVDTSGSDRLSVADYSRRAAIGKMWGAQASLDAYGEDLRERDPRAYGESLAELAKWAALAGDGARARHASRRALRLAPSPRTVLMALLAVAPSSFVRWAAATSAPIRQRWRSR